MKINIYNTCEVLNNEQGNCFARGLEALGNWCLSSARSEHGGLEYKISRKHGKVHFETKKSVYEKPCYLIQKLSQFLGFILKHLALVFSPQLKAKYLLVAAYEAHNLKQVHCHADQVFGPIQRGVSKKDGYDAACMESYSRCISCCCEACGTR